ncbi:HalOD1 output domain-containing protein [Natrarchaeobius sp. A-rgal3]|uniref:DUF7504 family protein n=1 Tax=Natrarchaeobius versutus TaxID=1679078 RepID=UPI00350FC716
MPPDENSRRDSSVLPTRARTPSPSGELPSRIVTRAVADAVGVGPLAVPALDEVVDPDAFDAVVRSCRWRDGTWPAITFTYADHDVIVTGTDDVTVVPVDGTSADERPSEREWTHVSPTEASRSVELGARLDLAVADETDVDRCRVQEAIDEVIDRWALSRLNRIRPNGIPRTGATVRFSVLGCDVVVSPEGAIATGSTLERLQHVGANVLVVGTVPDAISDRASARLLGTEDGPRERIVGLLDRSTETALERLSLAGGADQPARVIRRGAVARSSAVADSTASSNAGQSPRPRIETVDGDIESALSAVETAIDGIDRDADLRLCLDSLRPLLEDRDAADARSLLEPICRRVRERNGVGHYVLPIDRESEEVEALEGLFDATVELRIDGTEPVQRWHLHASDHVTDWFAC